MHAVNAFQIFMGSSEYKDVSNQYTIPAYAFKIIYLAKFAGMN